MSPLLKKILAAVLTLILGLLGGGTVAAGTYGVGYATGWEGPQVGPLLIYRGTFAALLGSICGLTIPATAAAGYAGYRLFQKANRDPGPPAPPPVA